MPCTERLLTTAVSQGADDLCPLEVYCPDGAGSAPFGGRRQGGTGDDQWAPYGSDGANRWVQTGIWGGDPGNTCMGHHQIAGGVHGNPVRSRCLFSLCLASAHTERMDVVAQGWGTDGQWVADAGYLDWILCCSAEAMGALITINNANFEENPEVASYEYKLPNGWDGSGGGTVVVKSPPSAPM